MVRADLLDAVDDMLRRYRSKNEPFGGVQLLLIGDLQQLAPVVKEDEWALLKQHYASAFFFHSKALAATRYVAIELKHVYRQQDREFVDLLNRVHITVHMISWCKTGNTLMMVCSVPIPLLRMYQACQLTIR